MKNAIKYLRNITTICITLFVLLFLSCRDAQLSENNPLLESEEKVSIKIGLVETSRSVFPDIKTDDFESFILECDGTRIDMWLYDQETERTAYLMMMNGTVEVSAGEHNFLLTGILKDGAIYQASLTQIVEENSVLNFALLPTSILGTGSGNFICSFIIPNDRINSYKIILYATENGKDYNIEEPVRQRDEATGTYMGNVSLNSIPSGIYVAVITLYAESNFNLPVYSCEENVVIINGKESKLSKTLPKLQKVYTITYHTNGAAISSESQKYTALMNVELESLTKENLDFGGWYNNQDFTGNAITGWSARTYTNDIDLYAKWNYTVSFNGNGSEEEPVEGQTASIVGVENHTVTLTENGFTRDGYLFDGWTETNDGSGTVYEDCMSNFTASSHTTLYAKWKPVEADKIAVSFRSNGGNFITLQQIESGSSVTEPNVLREGYELEGWYTRDDFASASKVDFTTFRPTEDTILYAKWSANEYSITYKDIGNLDFTGNHEAAYTSIHTYGIDSILDTPTKTDYAFLGWYLTSDATGEAVTTLAATAYTDSITLYAKWVRQIYHVSESGSSEGDGSLQQPFAAILPAVNAIQSAGEKIDYTILVSGRVLCNTTINSSDLTSDKVNSLTIKGFSNNENDILDGNASNYVLRISTEVPLTFKDIKITNGKSLSNTAGILISNPSRQVTLESGTLVTGNICNSSYSSCAGGIYHNSGTLTIEEGAKITDNYSYKGAGLYINGVNSFVIMNGGEISGNSARSCGSGVYIGYSSVFTMNAGKISNNTSPYAAGVEIAESGGRFIMNGGEISGNRADNNGGGVRITAGTFEMNGGLIVNNTANSYGGAVYYDESGLFYMQDSAYIPAGEEKRNDVFLYNYRYNRKINISSALTAPTPVASISQGSYQENNCMLTSDYLSILEQAKDKFDYIFPDTSPWNIEIEEKNVVLKRPVYNISYLAKGGSELDEQLLPTDIVTHKYGTSTILPVITRPGYVFLGWYKESDCSGIRLTELTADSISADVVLYADWEEEFISVNVFAEDIAITKEEDSENGTITLIPASGFTDYSWTINGSDARSVIEGASLSPTDSSLTFSKASLTQGRSYSIVLTAKNANNKTFMTLISIKK